MLEQLVSIAASGCVCIFAINRLNALKAKRPPGVSALDWISANRWRALEVAGLAILAGGALGVAAQWFIHGEDLHAETIALLGGALFGLGISRGRLALSASVFEWDGLERRGRAREAAAVIRGLSTDELEGMELMHNRFMRRD